MGICGKDQFKSSKPDNNWANLTFTVIVMLSGDVAGLDW
jgi:hypothetical protein